MRRGFSLVELMIVVAIVGILAALSAFTLSSVNELGRLNGNAQVLSNIMRTARTRAITERCTYVVQLNGPRFSPTADMPRQPSTVVMWRKNNCQTPPGTIFAYEIGLPPANRDRRVNDYNLLEFNTTLFFSPQVTAEAGNQLQNGSVSIGWQPDGTRTVWADPDGDGVSDESVGFAPAATLQIAIRPTTGALTPVRIVSVPPAAPAVGP
ncbi:MAG: prepilin-type N-terminal cleavage/methylation domain-containing protein [Myxococcales bacterium]|nr:prepilin-type N-terminal cleavage/methylation domain-containing protein [Myxococcales bacterium]